MIDADPAEVGMDATRLARIDAHFRRYVDDGRLPGWSVLVSRRGKVVHRSSYGLRDVEAGLPVEDDTLWRIYSMTKPITSAVAMSLYEEGRFQLGDPVAKYLPSFSDLRVWTGTDPVETVPAVEPVRIWHLLSHTAGLTYGFMNENAIDAMYRAAGSDVAQPPGMDLAGLTDLWASMPLLAEPGTRFSYSVATDVVGRLIEVLTGRSLDEVFAERVFGPLGMADTQWHVEGAAADRLAALYAAHPQTLKAFRYDQIGSAAYEKPVFLSGGGGLISSVADYHRFTQLLLRGGELDGHRLLGPRTLAYMTRNHLPGGVDLNAVSTGQWAETNYAGVGFGLGFAVVQDAGASKILSTAGEFNWGGLASTAFWVDPAEQLTAVFMTQLMPSRTHPIRPELRALVYQSVVA